MSHQNQQEIEREDNSQIDILTACFGDVRSSDIEISYARRTDGATFTFG